MKVSTSSFAVVKTFKLICASILMLSASVAFAEPAVVITDFNCGFMDGDGNSFSTTDTQITKASNPSGNAVLKCRATGVPNDTGTTVKYDAVSTGQPCFSTKLSLNPEYTWDWKLVIDTDGDAVMTCKFRDLN